MAGTRLSGATVLITGAGSGIGRLMALGAAKRGARIVIWDLSSERGTAVRDELTATGAKAWAYTVDVSNKDSVRAAAEQVLNEVGTVDVLFNNAGVVSGKPLTEATDEAIERTFGVNVMSLYWVTKAFLPAMIEQGHGHVVTTASAAGLIGVAKQTDYSASKHAAVGFDEALRNEMRTMNTGVKTTVVTPYYIDTGMFDGVRTRFPLLLPILKEAEVAKAVLDGVEAGKKKVALPPLVGVLPVMRVLPLGIFDRVADILGINQTMEHFTGRPGDVAGATPAAKTVGTGAGSPPAS